MYKVGLNIYGVRVSFWYPTFAILLLRLLRNVLVSMVLLLLLIPLQQHC